MVAEESLVEKTLQATARDALYNKHFLSSPYDDKMYSLRQNPSDTLTVSSVWVAFTKYIHSKSRLVFIRYK